MYPRGYFLKKLSHVIVRDLSLIYCFLVHRSEWNQFLLSIPCPENLEWKRLTYHHKLESTDGTLNYMLGDDRISAAKVLTERIASQCYSINKEDNPYYAVLAAPRQGKSLFLDNLCDRLRLVPNVLAIGITYNSTTKYDAAKEKWNITSCFFARVVHAILMAAGVRINWTDLNYFAFSEWLTIEEILQLCCLVVPQFSRSHKVVFLVDEFTKCLSEPDCDVPNALSEVSSEIYSSGNAVRCFLWI